MLSEENIKQIDHPDHYKDDQGRECIDMMEELFGIQAVMGFCQCNVYKYTWRAGRKQGEPLGKDLAKAQWYQEKLCELEKKLQNNERQEKEKS